MLLPIVEKPTSDEASGPKGPVPGETIAIEPATAMRVFRSTGSRFHSLRYNKQAGMVDDLAGGLLLSPLRFDAEVGALSPPNCAGLTGSIVDQQTRFFLWPYREHP